MIYIASDHAGFELKQQIISFLQKSYFENENLGPTEFILNDDYPIYAKKVVKKVLANKDSIGILICDTGLGMDITANKFKGIRSALCMDTFFAKRAKEHNNANILVLSALYVKMEIAQDIIFTFINTSFSNEERHQRRIDEIDKIL